MIRASLAALSFAILTVLGTHALAGTGAAAADALFREGVALAQKGELQKAVEKFKASYELEPAPGTLQGLAMAEEKLGQIAAAWTHYRELLERATAANDKKRVKLAKERIIAVEGRLSKLTITVTGSSPDGAELKLDGNVLPAGALGTSFPVDPGSHVVTGSAPDGSKLEKKFEIAEGQVADVALQWDRPESSEPTSITPSPVEPAPITETRSTSGGGVRTVGIIVGVAGVVLAGAGAYFFVQSNSTYKDVEDQCPNDRCPESTRDRVDEGKQQELFARIGLIGGGVLIATGATLFIVGGPKERRTGYVRPFITPTSAGVAGRF